jgi:predicted Zn-dependent protease
VILAACSRTPVLLALMVTTTQAIGQSQREALKARAQTLLAQMEFGRALAEAQAFNRAMPDDIAGYQLMAAAQIELGDYADAEKQIQWMLDLRIGKADSTGWLLVARFREATGDVDGALEAVSLAGARLQPGQDGERETLAAYAARLLCFDGKPAVAEQALGRFASTPAAAADTLQALAEVRLAQGRRAEAVEILRRLAASGPSQPHLLYMLAEATNAASDYTAFERAALAVTGNADNANRELALYYAGSGKQPAKALEVARRESLRRHDILTLDALAVALFANHQKSEAHDVMQRVLAVGTRRPEILRHAARIGIKLP